MAAMFCIWGAHWRHLKNTKEPSVCGGDAALCQITLTSLVVVVVVVVVMAALCNRAGHYIFALWFLLSILFPHLISAVADWMSTVLPQMVWP